MTASPAPSPRWGEGWGEGVPDSRICNPSPGALRAPTSPYGRGGIAGLASETEHGRSSHRPVVGGGHAQHDRDFAWSLFRRAHYVSACPGDEHESHGSGKNAVRQRRCKNARLRRQGHARKDPNGAKGRFCEEMHGGDEVRLGDGVPAPTTWSPILRSCPRKRASSSDGNCAGSTLSRT